MRISIAVTLLAGVTPACALSANYLNQFASGQASVKPSTFKPSGTSGKVSSGTGGYLDNLAGESAPAAPVAEPAAPAFSFSLSSEETVNAVSAGAYLDSLPTQAATSGSGLVGYLDVLRTESAPSGAGLVGYLDVLRTESAPAGSGPSGYLDAIGSETKVVKPSSSTSDVGSGTMIAQAPVVDAIKRLGSQLTSNQERTMAVLQEISNDISILADNAEAKKTARAEQTTELTNALAAQQGVRVFQ